MNWDAPDFPNDKSIAENCTLLILAGPRLDTQRRPLAWIAEPAVRSVADAEPAEGRSRAAQVSWQRRAAGGGGAGEGGARAHRPGDPRRRQRRCFAGERIGHCRAMSETAPELDFLKDGFNTAKLLGDRGAGSAVTNLALAVAWTIRRPPGAGRRHHRAGSRHRRGRHAPARARRVDPTMSTGSAPAASATPTCLLRASSSRKRWRFMGLG